MSDIKKTEDIFLKLIAATKNIIDLEAIRIKALGKKGEVTKLMKTISLMEEEERRTKAPLLNALKDKIIENIEKKKLSINTDILNEKISTEWLDISRPSRSRQKGKIHPISQVTEEIVEIGKYREAQNRQRARALPKHVHLEGARLLSLGDRC